MKSKLFRVMVVLMILATLTLTNFIYVGVGAISYAASANDTNHKNVEFTANLKDEKTLTLGVNVKNEGYFNGEVSLENNNFKMKSSSSEYVNKVEENKITLNSEKDSYKEGEIIGICEVLVGDKKVGEVELYCDRDIEKANFFENIKYNLKNLFKEGI